MSFCPPEESARRVATIRDAAEDAGRDPKTVEIASYVNAYAGPDVDAARLRMKRLIVQYAVQPTHAPAFASVFPGLEEAAEAWRSGDRAAALALVPDDAVDAVTPVGDASTIVDRLADLHGRGVDLPVLFPNALAFGDAGSSEGTIRRVAAELRARQGSTSLPG